MNENKPISVDDPVTAAQAVKVNALSETLSYHSKQTLLSLSPHSMATCDLNNILRDSSPATASMQALRDTEITWPIPF
jgi:hypothetical protein